MGLYSDLVRRGIAQCSTDEMDEILQREPITLYLGCDPTADSLHLGHMVPIVALSRFQAAGHKAVILVGGGTAMIGDPSGKSEERVLLTTEQVAANAAAIKLQLQRFLTFDGPNPAIMVDNYDWIGSLTVVTWLREVGKYLRANDMLTKDSVKRRIEGEQGISFTEFSYGTLQAYDFLHLYDAHHCTLQIGGSDQFGNISLGFELIRKARGAHVHGLTFPLMMTSDGRKFGKTAEGALWLDPNRTSPFELSQYFIQANDQDVETWLRLLTFLPNDEIDAICAEHRVDPGKRVAQRALAHTVTAMIHGEEAAAAAEETARQLFSSPDAAAAVLDNAPTSEISRALLEAGCPASQVLRDAGIVSSLGEARRLVAAGGVSVNGARVQDAEASITVADITPADTIVIRKGKKYYHILKVV